MIITTLMITVIFPYIYHTLAVSAHQMRRSSRGVTVVVASDDPDFLSAFAQMADDGRLTVWENRVLVVTRLERQQFLALMKKLWVLSMLNTMLLNEDDDTIDLRCSLRHEGGDNVERLLIVITIYCCIPQVWIVQPFPVRPRWRPDGARCHLDASGRVRTPDAPPAVPRKVH